MTSTILNYLTRHSLQMLCLRWLLPLGIMPLLFLNGLLAQDVASPKLISVDAIRLIHVNMPVLHYLDSEGEYQLFKISNRSRGERNKLPKSGQFTLYKEGLDENNHPIMVPAFEISVRGIGDGAILFFFSNEHGKVQYRLIDDSIDHKHTALSARLVNLTDSIVVCKVGDEMVRLKPNEDRHADIKTDASKRFAFGFAMQEVDGFKKYSPVKTLKFPMPTMRFMAAITYDAFTTVSADGSEEQMLAPTCVRLYDKEVSAW